MHKLAFCLRAELRLSFQLTLDAGVFHGKKQSRGSRTIVCHKFTCIRSVYKLSYQRKSPSLSSQLGCKLEWCWFCSLSSLHFSKAHPAQHGSAIYCIPPCISGSGSLLLAAGNISESDMFFLFLFMGKKDMRPVCRRLLRKNALTVPHLWIWAAVSLCFSVSQCRLCTQCNVECFGDLTACTSRPLCSVECWVLSVLRSRSLHLSTFALDKNSAFCDISFTQSDEGC